MTKNKQSLLLSLILAAAYFVSACGATLPQDSNSNDANSNASPIASSTPILPSASATSLSGGSDLEVFGIVESMTETTITINGVTYNIVADLTQFNDVISVGDQVRISVIVNADGTFTIREIEFSLGNENSNGNTNTNSNANTNTNANSNDASNTNSNTNDDNSNDDNGNSANSNDDNSNDDNGNDNGGNDNDNDSSGSGSGGIGNDDNGGNDNEDNGGNDNG